MEVIKKWYDQLLPGVSEQSDHTVLEGGPNCGLSSREQDLVPGLWTADAQQPRTMTRTTHINSKPPAPDGATRVQAWGP